MTVPTTKRMYEIDIAKCFAIFFMIMVHLYEYFGLNLSNHYVTDILISAVFGGSACAPLFMFCMGVCLTLSRHSTPKQLFTRGWKLLLAGVALDVCRFVIPGCIAWLITSDASVMDYAMSEFLGVDILMFAGLFFMLFAFMRKLNASAFMLVLIGVTCSVIGFSCVGVSTGSLLLDRLTSFFIRSTELSFFPLLNWSLFPIAGYLFGLYLLKIPDRAQFYKRVSLPCGVAAVLFLTLACVKRYGVFSTDVSAFYGQGLDQAMVSVMLSIFIFGLCYRASAVLPQKVLCLASIIGNNLTRIYCISWVIILVLLLVNYIHPFFQGVWMAIVLTFPVMVLSVLLARFYELKLKRH